MSATPPSDDDIIVNCRIIQSALRSCPDERTRPAAVCLEVFKSAGVLIHFLIRHIKAKARAHSVWWIEPEALANQALLRFMQYVLIRLDEHPNPIALLRWIANRVLWSELRKRKPLETTASDELTIDIGVKSDADDIAETIDETRTLLLPDLCKGKISQSAVENFIDTVIRGMSNEEVAGSRSVEVEQVKHDVTDVAARLRYRLSRKQELIQFTNTNLYLGEANVEKILRASPYSAILTDKDIQIFRSLVWRNYSPVCLEAETQVPTSASFEIVERICGILRQIWLRSISGTPDSAIGRDQVVVGSSNLEGLLQGELRQGTITRAEMSVFLEFMVRGCTVEQVINESGSSVLSLLCICKMICQLLCPHTKHIKLVAITNSGQENPDPTNQK